MVKSHIPDESVNPWRFNRRPVTSTYPIERYWGFLYCITHKPTRRRYVGRKACWCLKWRRFPLGFPSSGTSGSQKARSARSPIVETDWLEYWGSSKHLARHIREVGTGEFRRDILEWHTDQWSLHEAEKAFLFQIEDWGLWYNSALCLQYYKPKQVGRHKPTSRKRSGK